MTAMTATLRNLGHALSGFDRVWAALLFLFSVLALTMPGQAWDSARFTAESFLFLLPFLILSVLLAGALKAAGADQLIGAAVSASPLRAVVLAAVFGALSPFCSCGVVPIVASLLAAGVPLPPVMAFWLASPIMDPEMFVLSSVTLGVPFTVAKTLAAIAIGLLAGFVVLALQRAGWLGTPLRSTIARGGCGQKSVGENPPVRWAFWREPARRRVFAAEASGVGLFLAKWMLLAFALESLMIAWVPQEVVADYLGGAGVQSILLAAAVGVPAYLNGYAAIPLVGGLMDLGMAPGAALTFMVAGGATSIPAAMAVFAIVRAPVFLWYLWFALSGALLVGLAYQGILALL